MGSIPGGHLPLTLQAVESVRGVDFESDKTPLSHTVEHEVDDSVLTLDLTRLLVPSRRVLLYRLNIIIKGQIFAEL